MLYPIKFHPLFKERVWGGRSLERLYHKPLPAEALIGESWEISDRPGDASVIANGPLSGKDLRWLMENHRQQLLGSTPAQSGRFPLLAKILDAREKLSLQVHPPADIAAALGGEPKTEMWYITHAARDAELYVGLRRGVTRAEFERKTQEGTVADCFHRLPVQAGDAMFLPSGRVHAIGAGLVLFEIQQNSDTTYRVFDWNRVGADGKPRELHLSQALASIDFADFEPRLVGSPCSSDGRFGIRPLVREPLFTANLFHAFAKESLIFKHPQLRILAVVDNQLTVADGTNSVELRAGEFCLIPACVQVVDVRCQIGSRFMLIEAGE